MLIGKRVINPDSTTLAKTTYDYQHHWRYINVNLSLGECNSRLHKQSPPTRTNRKST
ncbi:hypothetical protein [Anabaena azotica]|uniref:Transposase n=1 Tax=Anabaena azotica FACHB-119 TaxID=947527 RepID=A0ABR8D6V5_9NOST|nr:hypothetical protein [Anabaena azotica]MBD2502874.1 hypothetical protein [Anabaena azotica FACHB-119]